MADVPLSSEVQLYKSIVISSSYYQSVHDRSYIIIIGNNPTSLVLTLAHAKSRLTLAKSRLTRANEYIETLPSNQWYTSTELGIGQSIFIFSNSKQGSYYMRITTSLLLSKLICGAIASCITLFSSHHMTMA